MRLGDVRAAALVFGSSPEARLALMRALWPQLVGEQVARRTEVASLTGDFLRVRVADARWRKVLPRLRRDILNRMQQAMGALAPRQIGLLEGPLTTPPGQLRSDAGRAGSTRPGRRGPEKPPAAPTALTRAACVISDGALREAFLATAGRYLATAAGKGGHEPSV